VNEIAEIFEYAELLFYADDMKLFFPVCGFQDYLRIQNDLNSLTYWKGIILDRVATISGLGVGTALAILGLVLESLII
jgi:hypothetical protein